MLVRRDGETLAQLLTRLDKAVAKALDEDIYTDEINPSSLFALIHTTSRVHFENSWTQPVIPPQPTITYQTAWNTRLPASERAKQQQATRRWQPLRRLVPFG